MPLVAVVTEAMARSVWGRDDVVGECLLVIERDKPPPPCTEIVGVAEDQLPGIAATAPRQVYWLPTSHPGPGAPNLNLVLARVQGDEAAAIERIRATVRAAVPDARFIAVSPLGTKLAPQLRSWRLGANLLSVFGLLALLVAGAGLYSVLSFDVAQRRFELGVRTALGAGAGRLVRAVASRALLVTAVGAAAGFIAAAILGRLAESMLFGVGGTDGTVYIVVAITLAFAGAAALAVPIARAARTDPMTALRQE
jgi:predicted lysophospholipase L1 biosynthesis ABC-type transport system permease subunit